MRYRHKRLTKYDEYEFEMIKKHKRYFSKCLVCGKILSNSCLNQLKAHRLKCISKRPPPVQGRRDGRGGKVKRASTNIAATRTHTTESEVKIEDTFDYDYPASLVETKYDRLSDDDDSSDADENLFQNFNQSTELFDSTYSETMLETKLESLENTKCRGCFTYKVNILFSEAIEFYSEETHRNEDITYLSMFHECTSIKINQNYDNSEGLCNYCAEELTIAYSFRRKCLYANHQYMLLVNEERTAVPQESTSQDNSMQSLSNPPSMVSEIPIEDVIEIVDDDDILELPTPATSSNSKHAKRSHNSSSTKKSTTPPEYIDINYENLNGSLLYPTTKHRTSGAGQTFDYHKKYNDLDRRAKLGLLQAATRDSQQFKSSDKNNRRLHK